MRMAICRRDVNLHVGPEQQWGLWSHIGLHKVLAHRGLKTLVWYPTENYGLRGALRTLTSEVDEKFGLREAENHTQDMATTFGF